MVDYARIEYIYEGGDSLFAIPFSYIKKEHITVLINGEITENYTYLNDTQIRVLDTLTGGDKVVIQRITPIDEKMVVFSDTSILDKNTQNLAQTQLFNTVQELYDNNAQFEINTTETIEANKQEVINIIAQNKEETDNQIEANRQELNQELLKFQEDIDTQIENFENTVNDNITSFQDTTNTQFSAFKTEINSSISEYKNQIDSTITDFESEVNTSMSEYQNQINTTLTGFENEIDTFVQNTNTQINDFKSSTEENLENYKINIDTQISSFKEDVNTTISDFTSDITVMIEDVQAAADKIDELEGAVTTAVEAADNATQQVILAQAAVEEATQQAQAAQDIATEVLNTAENLADKDLSNLTSTGNAKFANPSLSNLNTTGQSVLNNKANIDLSNLSATGQAKFDAKVNTSAVINVAHGGTGLTTIASGQALIGNGTGNVTTRAITNNTTANSTVTANTNLITANTLANWNGNNKFANIDLSNLSSSGNAKFNNKANIDLDNLSEAGIEVIKQNSGAGMPVGTIFPHTCSASFVPENSLPCDGTEYSKTQFSTLWTNWLVGEKLNTCTYEEYEQEITSTGECLKWGLDVANGKFKVPTKKNIIVSGSNETVPVMGNGKTLGFTNGVINFGLSPDSGSGVNTITSVYNVDVGNKSFTGETGDIGAIGLTTDATKSGAVADVSNVLKTKDIRYFVVVATGSINQSEMDWSAWASSLQGKANVDMNNLSTAGKAEVAGLAMPSDKYIDLTLGASGSTYTAPADGYFGILGISTAAYGHLNIVNLFGWLRFSMQKAQAQQTGGGFVPVNKGATVLLEYASMNIEKFRFVYAQGAQ